MVRALSIKRVRSSEWCELGFLGCDLVLELSNRDQVIHRVEIVDVQLAGQMVELVLHCPRQQALATDLDLAAVPVLSDDPDLLLARDIRDVAWDREAAFQVIVLTRRADDLWVDQLVQLTFDFDNARLQGNAELRSSEADSGRRTHRVCQVVEQL